MPTRRSPRAPAASVGVPPPDAAPARSAAATTGAPLLSGVLGYLLAQASTAANGVFAREVGEQMALRPVEYTILAVVRESPGLSSARLAEMLAVTPANITFWIDRLAKRGLVVREPSLTDRRERELHPTDEGAELAAQATRALVAAEGEAFAHLSAGERAILAELLQKLALRRDGA